MNFLVKAPFIGDFPWLCEIARWYHPLTWEGRLSTDSHWIFQATGRVLNEPTTSGQRANASEPWRAKCASLNGIWLICRWCTLISLLSTLILSLASCNLTQPWNLAIYLDDLPEKWRVGSLLQEGTAYKKQHSVHFLTLWRYILTLWQTTTKSKWSFSIAPLVHQRVLYSEIKPHGPQAASAVCQSLRYIAICSQRDRRKYWSQNLGRY